MHKSYRPHFHMHADGNRPRETSLAITEGSRSTNQPILTINSLSYHKKTRKVNGKPNKKGGREKHRDESK
jgi:hypothetical protein